MASKQVAPTSSQSFPHDKSTGAGRPVYQAPHCCTARAITYHEGLYSSNTLPQRGLGVFEKPMPVHRQASPSFARVGYRLRNTNLILHQARLARPHFSFNASLSTRRLFRRFRGRTASGRTEFWQVYYCVSKFGTKVTLKKKKKKMFHFLFHFLLQYFNTTFQFFSAKSFVPQDSNQWTPATALSCTAARVTINNARAVESCTVTRGPDQGPVPYVNLATAASMEATPFPPPSPPSNT